MRVTTERNEATQTTVVKVYIGEQDLRTGSPEFKFLRSLQKAWDRYDAAKRQEEGA